MSCQKVLISVDNRRSKININDFKFLKSFLLFISTEEDRERSIFESDQIGSANLIQTLSIWLYREIGPAGLMGIGPTE